MKRLYGYTYEVRFNTSDYTYVTGNSAFYDFRGAKLYSKFDSLLANNSLEILERQLASKAFGKPFILDIYAGARSLLYGVRVGGHTHLRTGSASHDRA